MKERNFDPRQHRVFFGRVLKLVVWRSKKKTVQFLSRARSIHMMVGECMTRRVITIAPDSSIVEAAKLMLDHKVSGLPVVDAARHVVGIISEHDLLRRRESGKGKQPHWLQLMIERTGLINESAQFHERKVSEVMTANPITVAPTSPLREACRLIEEDGIKRLPVVHNGELVGIIARADLVRAFAQTVDNVTARTMRDESIDDQLRELQQQILRNRARLPKPF
jgi:CBS domain-containing protein